MDQHHQGHFRMASMDHPIILHHRCITPCITLIDRIRIKTILICKITKIRNILMMKALCGARGLRRRFRSIITPIQMSDRSIIQMQANRAQHMCKETVKIRGILREQSNMDQVLVCKTKICPFSNRISNWIKIGRRILAMRLLVQLELNWVKIHQRISKQIFTIQITMV